MPIDIGKHDDFNQRVGEPEKSGKDLGTRVQSNEWRPSVLIKMHVVCKHIWITKIVADNVWDWTRQFIPKV
jgi:hypothetical protein